MSVNEALQDLYIAFRDPAGMAFGREEWRSSHLRCPAFGSALQWTSMAILTLLVNGVRRRVDVDPSTPLLWVLRENLRLTGAKFGCGAALCGACTVLVNGEAVRSCVTPVSSVANGERIVTIEGADATPAGAALQQAWLDEDVVQCGYCQPGQIMAAAALLLKHPKPTDDDIDRELSGVLCRCSTYHRIRRAIHRGAAAMSGGAR